MLKNRRMPEVCLNTHITKMLHFIEVGYMVNNFRFNLILHCVKQLTTIVILYNCFDKMIE